MNEEEDIKRDSINCDFDKIKKTVLKSIREYERSNSLINVSNFELCDITKDILNNPINEEYINGIKNSLIIRTLVLSAIDREVNKKGEVIYKALFMRKFNTAAPNYDNRDGSFYFYTIFFEEGCVIYELTNIYSVIRISKYNKKDYKYYKYCENKQIFKINFDENKKNSDIYLDAYTFRYNLNHKDNNFEEFKKFIISQGFEKAVDEEEKLTFTDKKLSYFLLFVLALLIITVISIVLRGSIVFFSLHK